jgi:hypothetical protein
MKFHPGPRIDRIPAQGGVGLFFVLATLFIVLYGVPESRGFLVASAVAGFAVAAVLRFTHR